MSALTVEHDRCTLQCRFDRIPFGISKCCGEGETVLSWTPATLSVVGVEIVEPLWAVRRTPWRGDDPMRRKDSQDFSFKRRGGLRRLRDGGIVPVPAAPRTAEVSAPSRVREAVWFCALFADGYSGALDEDVGDVLPDEGRPFTRRIAAAHIGWRT